VIKVKVKYLFIIFVLVSVLLLSCCIKPEISDIDETINITFFGNDIILDIIAPVEISVNKVIHEDLPEMMFTIKGFKAIGSSAGWAGWEAGIINSITITYDNGMFFQELTDFESVINPKFLISSLSFEDWNFDGYIDISLTRYDGVSSSLPHYYWLWDIDKGLFVRNVELEEFSNYEIVGVDKEENLVYSTSGRMGHYTWRYYKYEYGKYVLVKKIVINRIYDDTWSIEPQLIYKQKTVITELIDGEMIVTDEYYEEWDISY